MDIVEEIGATAARPRRRPGSAGRIAPAAAAAVGTARPETPPGPRTALRDRHLLGIQGLEPDEITLVLDTARVMAEIATRPVRKIPTLRAKTVVNFFMEPSTRTRSSFEIAEKRLSADTLNFSPSASSVTKGESLLDTARNLEAMSPDMIVIRHKASGAPHFLARHCRSAIINAGDGWHEHPTQALLDAYTIRERKGRLKGLTVAIVGDLMHSRVLRSNLFLLRTMGAKVRLCGPPTLVPAGLESLGAEVHLRLEPALEGADVIMMLRVQRERQKGSAFPTAREYFNLFGMTRERVRLAKKDAIIMHPGPMNRGVEIDSAVADGPASVILEQVTNGVAVRMAVLYLLAGGSLGELAS
ncbi:MAG TPA: aspartate carbamoyltransferase catalytic subunit [Candidatus Polarisedimenticolia bacterium]|nr:aspartate carbamoyltransferase catalytic subunit [Candidatus Polarisedimenticolia bacterium]